MSDPVGAASEVLVVGEALIDLLPGAGAEAGTGTAALQPLDTVGYPDGAPTSEAAGAMSSGTAPYVAFASGGPTNTAIALARLGVPTHLAARISHDPFGLLLRRHIEANNVSLDYAVDATEQTTLAAVGIGERGDAEYSFYARGTADWQWSVDELPAALDPAIAVVHTGSLALALPPGGPVIENFLARARERAVISIDPNVRPDLVGDMNAYAETLERWIGLADIVKISIEDIAAVYPRRPPHDVVSGWAAPHRLIALTNGADGAEIRRDNESVAVPGVPVEVADTVAAGDTFTAGLLQGLLSALATRGGAAGRGPAGATAPPGRPDLSLLTADDLRAAATRGCVAAAITCSRPGPNPPFAAELGLGRFG